MTGRLAHIDLRVCRRWATSGVGLLSAREGDHHPNRAARLGTPDAEKQFKQNNQATDAQNFVFEVVFSSRR